MTIPKRMAWRAGLAALALGPCTMSYGQSVSSPAGDTPDAGSPLQEVVVTAQKRAETINKVPISITALTAEGLDKRGVKDINDVARLAPGLQVSTTGPFAATTVSIRGIFSTVGAATTGIYINDVPVQQRNDSAALPIYGDLFDVERVEVLRGPQGTLYGAGSEGGTIRFITVAPNLATRSSYARAELGATEQGEPTYELGFATGGPIIDNQLGFRASVWGRRDGGWIDRIANTDYSDGRTLAKNTNRDDSAAARLALAWSPAPNLMISPEVLIQRSFKRDTDLFWERDGTDKQELKRRQPTTTRNNLISNTISYQFAPLTVKWIASYMDVKSEWHGDESYFDVTSLAGDLFVPGLEDFQADYGSFNSQRFVTQELRFASNDDGDARLSWIGGVFWQRNTLDKKDREWEPQFGDLLTVLFGGGPEDIFGAPMLGDISYLADYSSVEQQTAVYGDLTYRMTDRLKLTAGLRVARSKFSFNNAQDGPWNGGASFGSGNNTETPVTPKFSASYDLNHGLLYATAAKGYRIGGANASLGNNIACRDEVHNTLGIDDVPLSYDSDTVMSYEAGYKDRVAGGRLAFAASAYWINWNHIQGNVALECFWSYTTNLGKAVSRGADLSLRLQATDGLALGLDVGYGDAHYTEDFHLVNGTVLALKGDDLPTPDFTGAFSLDYERPMAWGRSYARAEYNYSSAYHRTPASGVHGADQTVRDIPSLGLLSARLGIRRTNGLDVSLFGNNLTNADERVFRYHYTGLSTTFLSQTVRPRTFGVTATWTFD